MKTAIRINLDVLLESRGITRYELAKRTGIQYNIIDHYYKNRVTRYDSDLLLRMCNALDCEIGELIQLT